MPELDGLRGLAALLVLVAHYFGEVPGRVPGLAVGWIGVDIFFVLSGFLIGGILFDNRDSSNYFTTFYIRRSCRILPAYFAMLALTFAAMALVGERAWIDPPLPSVVYLTYTQNFVMAWRDAHPNHWLLPTWTLAVEEQFYLVLPLLLFIVPRRCIAPALLVFIASGPFTRACLGMTMAGFTLLPARWDLLFVGVLAAHIQRHHQVSQLMLRIACSGAALCTAAVALCPAIALHVVGHVFVAVAVAAYILLVLSGAKEGRWLRMQIFAQAGLISYGLYLIHQPINGLLHGLVLNGRPSVETPLQVAVTLGAMAISVSLAALLWHLFERPIVAFGRQYRYASLRQPDDARLSPRLGEDLLRTAGR